MERQATTAADRVAAGHRIEPGSISLAAIPATGVIARRVATLDTQNPVTTSLQADDLLKDLQGSILQTLRADPEDRFGTIRRRLARLSPPVRDALLERVEANGSPEDWEVLNNLLAKPLPAGTEALPEVGEEPESVPEPSPQGAPEEVRTAAEQPETGVTEQTEPEPTTESVGARAEPAVDLSVTQEAQPEVDVSAETEPEAETAGAETEEVAVPEMEVAAPEQGAEMGGAPPPAEPTAEPGAAPAVAGPLPAAMEDEGAGPDTGPVDALEAEVEEELGTEEEEAEPEAAPEEPAPAPAEPIPAAGATSEDGSGLADSESTPDVLPEEPVAEEPAPDEAASEELAPEMADEGPEKIEGTDLGGPEPGPTAEGPGEIGGGIELDEGAATGGDELPPAGGGGGVAIAEPADPEVPDVSGEDPVQALSTVGSLSPSQLAAALDGVSTAASRSVGEQRAELAANPPQMERPFGAAAVQGESAEAREAPPPADGPREVERAPQGSPVPVVEPEPLPPAPAPPTEAVRTPQVGSGSQQGISVDEAEALRESLHDLPTRDPALDVTAGPPPTLPLEGDADPERAREQRASLERGMTEARIQGQRDATQPMGEEQIYPDVPDEVLSAEMPAGNGGGAGPAGPPADAGGAPSAVPPAAAADDTAASIVAQEQQGEEIRAAVSQAQDEVISRRQEQATQAAEHQDASRREIGELVNLNAAEQSQERSEARTEVRTLRGEWTEAQQDLVEGSRTEAVAASQQGEKDLTDAHTTAEKKAAGHIQEGNRKAAEARRKGEGEAAQARQEAEKESESGGILGWLADRAKAFFDGVKRRIQQAFEAARKALRSAIEAAQRLAAEAIEAARRTIVGIIRKVGDALIAIGDKALAGFPKLRERFRNGIKDRVARAEAAVNRLADKLKEGVQEALNRLGEALDAALGLLERGMLAAVDAVAKTVRGTIEFARKAVQAFAAFAGLIRDVAANPGQWIRNLGAAIVDGIRNHLWRALKLAVQNWFSSKVEEMLGLGMTVWQLLKRGGIALAQIGRMVWEGLKQVIPMVLVQILIQRLAAIIVPAVGAIMAIIEALQAAWGTVGRIIQSFERFIAFLRAVKTGNAGPLFAEVLAAAAVAVIDFVSNFMLGQLRRRAGVLAGRIRAMAQRIGQRLRGLARAVRRGVRRLRTGVARFFRRRGRGRGARRRGSEDHQRRKQERLERAVSQIKPQAEALLRRGTSRFWLRTRLLWWRARYLLSGLDIDRAGRIIARLNPFIVLDRPKGKKVEDSELGALLMPIFAEAEAEYARMLMEDPQSRTTIETAQAAWARRDPSSLAGLSRFEQQMVVRGPAERGRALAEPDVTVWRSGRPSAFNVQAAGRYAAAEGRRAMLTLMMDDARTFGVSEQEIASILASRADTINVKISILAARLGAGGSATRQDRRAAFIRRLRRVAFLTLAGEPSRLPGISVTAAVSSTMAAQGRVSLRETHTAMGSQAPLAPEDAVRAPTLLPRVGRVFGNLLEQTKGADIIVAEGGYQLNDLATAIRHWLEQRMSRARTPEQLASSETLLRAELIRLLATFHGRG
ncbi:MAG TPA: hypothetical protein VEG34_06385 [Thermoanaerobaculia bacterium]|nr:hypothetical protein [Thermoanaerobaculia bacterium]